MEGQTAFNIASLTIAAISMLLTASIALKFNDGIRAQIERTLHVKLKNCDGDI